MGKRRFRIEQVGVAIIELDDAVIKAVDDEWRSQFYGLHTPEEIAEHVGYNLLIGRATLSQLDGWADQPDSNARIVEWLGEYEILAEEVKAPPPPEI